MNPNTPKINKNQPVINCHILEQCNFGCKFCYAHWPNLNSDQSPDPDPESGGTVVAAAKAWRNPESVSRILAELRRFPSLPSEKGKWAGRPRLNLAGGEPMLLWNKGKGPLAMILDEAERLGFDLSIITNGFLLTDKIVRELAPRLQILGISMDSENPDTNREIGRCGTGGQQIGPERIAEIFRLAREVNPRIECKLNTVVCAYNWEEDLRAVIGQIAPDRWKVFQMLPIADTREIRDKQQPLIVKDEWFEAFKSRHADLKGVMRAEDNDEMTESYVMVDPFGRFYQNEPASIGHRHIVSDPIHEVGVEKAWGKMRSRFQTDKFRSRYIPVQSEPVSLVPAL